MQLTRHDAEFISLINENHTEKLSTHAFMMMNESDKVSIGKGLVDQIYVNIAEKYSAINFESIPKSQGKIKSMREYQNLTQSLQLLTDIASDSKQQIPEINILVDALNNLVAYEETFFTGYMRKNSAITMTYNLLAMAVYCGTSLMISVLVDYINQGMSDQIRSTENVDIIIDKKYKKHQNYLMIESLRRFNEQVKNGTFSEAMKMYNRQSSQTMNESVTLTTGLVILGVVVVLKFIPLVRELIYIFFYTRMKLSEACAIQADLINGNMEALKNRGISNDTKVFKIQKWFADKLTKLSNAFAFTYEKGEKKAEIESKVKLTSDDVVLW